jgi:hypothetical protein
MSCDPGTFQTLCLPGTDGKPIVKGDSWPGFEVVYSIDGSPVDLTDAEIKLNMRVGGARPVWELSVGDGITITDAANGVFVIDSVASLNVPVGTLIGQLEITQASGERNTEILVSMTVINSTT